VLQQGDGHRTISRLHKAVMLIMSHYPRVRGETCNQHRSPLKALARQVHLHRVSLQLCLVQSRCKHTHIPESRSVVFTDSLGAHRTVCCGVPMYSLLYLQESCKRLIDHLHQLILASQPQMSWVMLQICSYIYCWICASTRFLLSMSSFSLHPCFPLCPCA
jgi:hypothetical protein